MQQVLSGRAESWGCDMETFEVAHINEQGQDIIIVVVTSSFGTFGRTEQNRLKNLLQVAANSAGLKGTVVPVWDGGLGRLAFLAPAPWLPFFRSLSLQDVALSINRTLTVNW